jgi:autotransporter-associated beta strand protein
LYWDTNLLTVNGRLVITNVPVSQSLTWDGGVGSNWNYTEADWRSAFGPGDTTYADTDPVTFDDSLSNGRNTINIVPFVQPGGIIFSNSATNTYTFVGSGGIAGITGLNLQSNGTVILDNTGSNTFTGTVTISNGTLQIGNNDTNGSILASVLLAKATSGTSGTLAFKRSDNLSYGGAISGNGTLAQNDTNILTLTGNNTNLHGAADILQGTLRLGAPNALGSGSNVSIVVSSGATLDLFSVPGTNFVTVSGAGVSGSGAIVNNGSTPAIPGISYLTMTTNATLGGLQRWDLRSDITNDSGAQPTNYSFLSTGGHSYNLTKVGTNVIGLVNSSIDPALGNIDIQAGALNYEGATDSLGNPTNTLTIETGATLELYNATNGLNKVIVFKDGSTNFNGAGSNSIFGPVTLSTNASGGPGNITFDISGTSQLLSNRISGPGNLVLTGGQPLYLSTANTYSGSTFVTVGDLYLVNSGSIGFCSNVVISSNAAINVAGRADKTFTVPSGQTLQGFGSIVGQLTVTAGGAVAPGTTNANGTLTVSSTVRLSGTAYFKINNIAGGTNDVLASQAGVINYGGTLQISNTTANPFTAGESFQLFSASFGYAGAFTNLLPATPGPGLGWDTNDLNVTGAISVVSLVPSPTSFTFITLNGSTLTFGGTNGIPNGTYVVLTSTNLTQPWTPVSTNTFNASGNFNFTETYNPSNQQQFFTIEQPY